MLELGRAAPILLILAGGAWLVVLDGVRSLATGRPTPAGLTGAGAALYALGAHALAAPGTFFVWAWLRRPRHGPPADPPAPWEVREAGAARRAREGAERTAWRSRP